MKILALDQSTVSTGWAYFIDGELIRHGVIPVKNNDKIFPSWLLMLAGIKNMMCELAVDSVVLEDTIMQKSVTVLKELARLQGGIVGHCFANQIKTSYLYPTQWRKLIQLPQKKGMKRREIKELTMAYVKRTYQIAPSEDECDAICIGAAYNVAINAQENKEKNDRKDNY